MKKRHVLTGIISRAAIAAMLVFGMVLAGCDNGNGDGDTVATPTASPAAGTVAYGTAITLSTATAGATIYYTTDGSTPTTSYGGSTCYYSGPIPVTAAVTIKAIAVINGTDSGELSAGYTITPFAGTDPGLYIGADSSPQTNTGTLALALSWLRDNSANNTAYTILIGADESLPSVTLGGATSGPAVIADGKTGVKIFLRGKDAERRVQLSGTGSLFTVKSGVTLVLDKNITLVGKSDYAGNSGPLVKIESGSLEMRENAKITGNANKGISGYYATGGGVYVSGTFSMFDSATVSGNPAGGGGSDSYGGGGVYVSSGTLSMFDNATVSGNTASGNDSSYGPYGGGVYISGGTFTMNGNASVSGNTAIKGGGGVWVAPPFLGGGVVATFTMNDTTSVSGNTASGSFSPGGGVGISSGGTFTMNGSASVSGNTASGNNSSYGGGVSISSGTFTMIGGTVYGSDGGANANMLVGSGTKQGVSLNVTSGTAKYGNGAYILLLGATYSDATLTGHN
jgi:hypothetical protein